MSMGGGLLKSIMYSCSHDRTLSTLEKLYISLGSIALTNNTRDNMLRYVSIFMKFMKVESKAKA